MTRDEAVEKLNAYIACESKKAHCHCDDNCDENCHLLYEQGTVGEHNEAINMAIEALEQIEKIESIINEPFYFRDIPDYLLRYKAICEVLKETKHDQRRSDRRN